MFDLMLFAQAADAASPGSGSVVATTLFPIAIFCCVAGLAFLVMNHFSGEDAKLEERLGRLGQSGQGATSPSGRVEDLLGGNTNNNQFAQMMEKANVVGDLVKPTNEKEASELKLQLSYAGYRSESAVARYTAIQGVALLFGLGLGVLVAYPVFGMTQNGMIAFILILGVFFYIPKIVLGSQISKRQEAIFLGLPDALDLMVVCVEAGLGLDAAMRKVCEELGSGNPTIAEEFSISNFQLQMGRPRREVLHDLGQRTGVDDMKSLAAILIQADRFGASIGQALRVQSDAMRTRRRQLAEERAAKTAVKLLIPLVLFIFPAVFVVLVGPAAVQIMDNLFRV